MLKRLLRFLPSLVSMLLLLASIWVIRQELQQYQSHDIWLALAAIPRSRLGWAIVLTLLNGLVFTGYDALAARYVDHVLPCWQTALAAGISIPVSNSVGLALLSGSAIRYRLYLAWGVSPLKIAQMIAFCNLSFWLGLLTVAGLLFLWHPVAIPTGLHLPFRSTQLIGLICLSMMIAYLLWNRYSRKTLRLGKLIIPHLPIHLCIGQIAVSSLDWTLAAAVLYVLLPDNAPISGVAYFEIYLLAQLAGIISNIPAGLGVFETVLLLLMSSGVSNSALLIALIAYRVVYYLMPLGIAVLLLAAYEIHTRSVKH